MEKPVALIFSYEAAIVYYHISKMSLTSKEERVMFDAIQYKFELIRKNPHIGNPVAKRLIPKEYERKYKVDNLYRLELPFFWRMLYTLRDNKVEIIAFVLDIIDHKKYNKKFGY